MSVNQESDGLYREELKDILLTQIERKKELGNILIEEKEKETGEDYTFLKNMYDCSLRVDYYEAHESILEKPSVFDYKQAEEFAKKEEYVELTWVVGLMIDRNMTKDDAYAYLHRLDNLSPEEMAEELLEEDMDDILGIDFTNANILANAFGHVLEDEVLENNAATSFEKKLVERNCKKNGFVYVVDDKQ